MKPVPDGVIRVTVHNRADGDLAVASFETPVVPRVGELVAAWPDLLGQSGPSFEAFGRQSLWRVDDVVWEVASPGSTYSLGHVREHKRVPDGGLLSWVDLLCWPESGPYWHEIPVWAPSKADEDE